MNDMVVVITMGFIISTASRLVEILVKGLTLGYGI